MVQIAGSHDKGMRPELQTKAHRHLSQLVLRSALHQSAATKLVKQDKATSDKAIIRLATRLFLADLFLNLLGLLQSDRECVLVRQRRSRHAVPLTTSLLFVFAGVLYCRPAITTDEVWALDSVQGPNLRQATPD